MSLTILPGVDCRSISLISSLTLHDHWPLMMPFLICIWYFYNSPQEEGSSSEVAHRTLIKNTWCLYTFLRPQFVRDSTGSCKVCSVTNDCSEFQNVPYVTVSIVIIVLFTISNIVHCGFLVCLIIK